MTKSERQQLCIERWKENRCVGILELATGFGKTRTALTAIKSGISKNPNLSVLISVPTDILQKQWNKAIKEFDVVGNVSVQIINSIIKTNYNVDLLIIDEVHTSLAEELVSIYKVVKFKYFMGLTGTLNRLDGREQILLTKIPVVDKITIEDALENNWLSEYRDYKVLISVDLADYNKYNQMFLKAFSVFNFDFNIAMKCASNVKLCNIYAKTMGINSAELRQTSMIWNQMLRKRKKFVQSHPRKLELTEMVLNKRSDKKIITFSATIDDSKLISKGMYMNSKQTKSVNKKIIEQFNSSTTGVLNTAKSADCGLDIEGLSVAIIISGTSSSIQKNQRIGRAIRFQKDKIAEIFSFVIKDTIEESWYNKASANKEYITITEDQFIQVLNNESIITRTRENNENETYRF